MKRRDSKTRSYLAERKPGETWGAWIGRLHPRGCAEADRRLARESLLDGWPGAVRVKTEYHRRTRRGR